MTNALANETSPYLLQHRDNPVDWLPWGDEALRRAREEDKPLLVSIGYSSCHWCHVMERESFVDEQTAQVMNEHFVCVKVDREERPDVDAVYMEAVQTMTGHGGWPLNVFVTPDQVPFFGGTYFPPAASEHMPSWTQVLLAISDAWRTKRDEIEQQGERMAQRLGMTAALRPSANPIRPQVLDEAHAALRTQFDQDFGGFGGAPKFPPSSTLIWLLERDADPMALRTLRTMAFGGIHDQVGGGFARYAVDRTWTVPHFEKMLYDNALLLRAYVLGFRRTGDALYREVAERLVGWLEREMTAPDGGFYAALDADTDHVEGATYTWTTAELREVLGDDAEAAIAWFGAGDKGNFVDPHHPQPGLNVLRGDGPRPDAETADRIRATLLRRRNERPQPGLDDKRLTAWNALMIGALADAGRHLGHPEWIVLATGAADFVLRALRTPEGQLLRTYNHGHAKLDAYLDDHALLVEALLDLYEATFEPRFFTAAQEIADALLERFADPEGGGFFQTAADAPALVVRRRDLEDAPMPSGSSSAALGLQRLAAFTGEARYAEAAVSHLRLVHEICPQHPQAFVHALRAIAWHTGRVREVALVGDEDGVAALRAVVDEDVRPHLVLAGAAPSSTPPLLEHREPLDGRAAAYVCEHFACKAPVADPDELRAALA